MIDRALPYHPTLWRTPLQALQARPLPMSRRVLSRNVARLAREVSCESR